MEDSHQLHSPLRDLTFTQWLSWSAISSTEGLPLAAISLRHPLEGSRVLVSATYHILVSQRHSGRLTLRRITPPTPLASVLPARARRWRSGCGMMAGASATLQTREVGRCNEMQSTSTSRQGGTHRFGQCRTRDERSAAGCASRSAATTRESEKCPLDLCSLAFVLAYWCRAPPGFFCCLRAAFSAVAVLSNRTFFFFENGLRIGWDPKFFVKVFTLFLSLTPFSGVSLKPKILIPPFKGVEF